MESNHGGSVGIDACRVAISSNVGAFSRSRDVGESVPKQAKSRDPTPKLESFSVASFSL
jgi:hypothetical protein